MNGKKQALGSDDRQRLVDLRRDFHSHPELGFQERRTAGVVAAELRRAGLDPREGIAETGVTALIGEPGRGPRLLLRADMDALPIVECDTHPFRSQNQGVMHACGHDGHVATLLTACSVLAREADQLAGQVLAVFQPAEEGLGGARRMIGEGLLADPKPEAAVGLHYWSGLKSGQVAVNPGPVMGAVDEFHLTISGRGGHAALPQDADDVVVAGAAVVGALQTVVSRRNDPLAAVLVTVGEFQAGSAFNVIAGEARLSGTVRCFDNRIWEQLPRQLEQIIAGVCRAHNCEYRLNYERLNRAVVNDPEVAALVREVAVDLVGAKMVVDFRTLGGEDMSEILEQVPGCFFFVGAASEAKGITATHHNPAFDIDEDALPIGVEMLLGVARRYLG
jgi:amidohydrolase